MKKLFFAPDVIFHRRNGRWFLSNTRALTHIAMSPSVFSRIDDYLAGGVTGYDTSTIEAEDCTFFSNLFGLMADPTHLLDESVKFFDKTNSSVISTERLNPRVVTVNGLTNIMDVLRRRMILIDDEQIYRDFFEPKKSLFDKSHYGTFHQQMGQALMSHLRKTPDEWWPTQKFSPEGEVLNNLYRYVQLEFFKSYFTVDMVANKTILDLGCGTGYYAEILLERGANVVGVDPNETYINDAKKRCAKHDRADFRVGIVSEETETVGKDETFDFIIISDMLLFYFSPLNPGDTMDPLRLLQTLRSRLNPGGVLYVTEPHAFFWLAPWMGDANKPFTVLTEYRSKKYSVTPTLSILSQTFAGAGFSIREIHEPVPSEECLKEYGERAYHFASEFPLWWVFILNKRG
jgi:2-polyprenyl-3-methyl-5-hydroxy-6-metoxy-1,4-benzoquinol methylase